MRSSKLFLLPAMLALAACNAVDSFNAVGDGVEEEMARQRAEAAAAAKREEAAKADDAEADAVDADQPAADR